MLLKREDLLHTGAHKINNTIGQCLLTRRMGKPRVIAETGAGQHGVATAAAAARFGLECTVYMGSEDVRRQKLNVERMKLLGAQVCEVDSGSRTLKDAINESLRDWVTRVRDTHYVLGSVLGPHPFPRMVRDFHRVIGIEAREQVMKLDRPACPTCWSPASAAAAMLLVSFTPSWATRRCRKSASRQAARACIPAGMRRASPSTASACCMARARWCFRTRTA